MLFFPVEDVNPTGRRPYVCYLLMALFVGGWAAVALDTAVGELALTSGAPTWTAALASLFLHADVVHLVLDLLFLGILADNVEDALGHPGFLLFFLGGGLFAEFAWLSTVEGNAAAVASSGPVTAVLGAYALLFPHSRIRFRGFVLTRGVQFTLPSWTAIPFWFTLQGVLHHLGIGSVGLNLPATVAAFVFGALVPGLLATLGLVDLHWHKPPPAPEQKNLRMPRAHLGLTCPRCVGEMETSEVYGILLNLCHHCGGMWLDRGELEVLLAQDTLPRAILNPPARQDSQVELPEGQRTCPRCSGTLAVREIRGTNVEYCRPCAGIFLDRGELGALLGR